MLFHFLLPKLHPLTLAGFCLVNFAGPVAVGAALGHTSVEGRGRVMNVPPLALNAHIAAVIGHGL
jgi:hypothetical protein